MVLSQHGFQAEQTHSLAGEQAAFLLLRYGVHHRVIVLHARIANLRNIGIANLLNPGKSSTDLHGATSQHCTCDLYRYS